MSVRGGRLKDRNRVWQAETAFPPFPRCTSLCLCATSYTIGLLIYTRHDTKIHRTYNLPPLSVPFHRTQSIHKVVQSSPSVSIIMFMLQSERLYRQTLTPVSPSPNPGNYSSTFCLCNFLTPEVFHMSGIIQNFSFHAWPIWLSKMSCNLSLS